MCAIVFLPMTRYTAKLDESFLDELATKIGQRKRGEGEALQAYATRIGMAMIRRGYDSALGLELVTNQSIEDVADIFLWAKKISGGAHGKREGAGQASRDQSLSTNQHASPNPTRWLLREEGEAV